MRAGRGVSRLPGGDEYEGDWGENQRHGRGTLRLAAGGSYRWDSAKGTIVRHPRAMIQNGRVVHTRVNHIAPEDARTFAGLLRGHRANLRLRDANGNACAHLACDAGNVAMAELCIEQAYTRRVAAPAA